MHCTARKVVPGVVLAVVLGMSLAACESTLPSATAILKSDGYSTPVSDTQAEINSSFGPAAPYITSAAAGVHKTGALEEVIVAGNTVKGVTGASFLSGAESQFKQGFPKATVTVSGSVLKITAPTAMDFTGGQS